MRRGPTFMPLSRAILHIVSAKFLLREGHTTLETFVLRITARSTADNKMMLQLYANTVVTKVHNEDDKFPRHRFDFVDFDKIEDRKGQDYILTDVIGRVVCEGNIQKTKVYGKEVHYLTVELEDIWGKRARITLWDRSAVDYQKQRSGLDNAVVIGVFTSNLVKDYMNSTTLPSTSATKIYLNVESDEVSEFKEKYSSTDGDESIKVLEAHGQKISRESILANKKTIAEILDIATTEFEDGANYFCQATIMDICNNNGWYRLELEVNDGSNSTKFIIFDEEAEKLIGQSATNLYDMEAKNEGREYDADVPFLIKNLTSSSYVFRLKLTTYNKTAYKQSFTANKVLDGSVLEVEENNMVIPTNETPNSATDDALSEVSGMLNNPLEDVDIESEPGPSRKRKRLRIVESDAEEDEPIFGSGKDGSEV